jgi:hypothetical protein
MTWKSDRPYGRLFTMFQLRIEALPQSDADTVRIVDAIDELEVVESLEALARRIEERLPDVRVEVR